MDVAVAIYEAALSKLASMPISFHYKPQSSTLAEFGTKNQLKTGQIEVKQSINGQKTLIFGTDFGQIERLQAYNEKWY